MAKAKAAAPVFCVPKADGRLREAYNGTAISGAAKPPPMPPFLPTPTALGYVEVGVDEHLWLSKLDGEAFFDQLKLNPKLAPCMGRPPCQLPTYWKRVA